MIFNSYYDGEEKSRPLGCSGNYFSICKIHRTSKTHAAVITWRFELIFLTHARSLLRIHTTRENTLKDLLHFVPRSFVMLPLEGVWISQRTDVESKEKRQLEIVFFYSTRIHFWRPHGKLIFLWEASGPLLLLDHIHKHNVPLLEWHMLFNYSSIFSFDFEHSH